MIEGRKSAERTPSFATGASALVGLVILAPLAVMAYATLSGDVAQRWARLDAIVLDRLVNTIVLAAGATVVGLAFALPMAFLLHRADFVGRRLLGILYIAPLLIPPHIHAVSWLRIFGNQGYITAWFAARDVTFDVRGGFIDMGGAPVFYPGATWMSATAFWPLAAIVISAGLARLDPRLEESAIVAVGRRRALLGVTLPLIRNHVIAGAFFVFLFTAGCHGIPGLLDTPVLMLEVFMTASNVDAVAAAVVALPLVAMAMVVMMLALWSARTLLTRGDVESARAASGALTPRSVGCGIAAWAILLVTAGWPFASLLRVAGPFSTYRGIWHNVLPEITNSLVLASTSGAIVTAAALAVAVAMLRARPQRAFVIEAAALLPMALPAVVVGVAANVFWSRLSSFSWIDRYVYGGIGISLCVHLMMFLPFALRTIRATASRIGIGGIEAALMTGRSRTSIFRRVLLPQLVPGIGASFVLVYVLALGELSASQIVNSKQWGTVQTRIFNMIHFARDEEVAALCVIVAVLALLPLFIYLLLSGRKVRVL